MIAQFFANEKKKRRFSTIFQTFSVLSPQQSKNTRFNRVFFGSILFYALPLD